MIAATVLHPGYIMQELDRAVRSPRYQELSANLIAWHEVPGHDCTEPPPEVAAILAELKAMKLHAFTHAGMLYRLALDEYEKRCDFERAARRAGFRVAPDTAIQYVDSPRPPIELDFDHPA